MANICNSALFVYLKKHNDVYSGKIQELREVIQDWLSYIPQTFPHYTRHTIQHSEEIINQLSSLLFVDDDPDKCVVNLSSSEVYILLASAYLHDAGMVVSDTEKAEMLLSEEWAKWSTGDGVGAKRWTEIERFRKEKQEDGPLPNFLADVQTRFLIAEFFRRSHHQRSKSIIIQHQTTLGRFGFDDPLLIRSISDVCCAHGLRQHELDDRERYPERRDIRGEKVNVRFLAILLRVGDLLDMSHDRACPLLLNAACPLPPESLAHWTQYQRIAHRLTAADRIEITAECQTQEEHRYLQDWCQWLVEELREAGHVMAHAARHKSWMPPTAELGISDASIVIRPCESATYIPSQWVFELDHDAIFQRLIVDAYSESISFLRELIQNALDANRCQMYYDIIHEGVQPPPYPTQVDSGKRVRYPVNISLVTKEITNELSGETEKKQIVKVEDSGIGMDREIIRKYFLQVGRSYYTTDEFRRNFNFIPTSRFGVGFLSVFAVSDFVKVDTFNPNSPNADGPVCLTLTGPQNYLLTDKGKRRVHGTSIEVLLREPLKAGDLTNAVSRWCKRVEFPVVITEADNQTIIEAECSEDFIYEMPAVTEKDAKFVVRSFPINSAGIEGELYVFSYIDKLGESWAKKHWATNSYPLNYPAASIPQIPESLVCFHGLSIGRGHYYQSNSMISRIDFRRQKDCSSLSRESMARQFRHNREGSDPLINNLWGEILQNHINTSTLSTGADGWKYRQRLVSEFPVVDYWCTVDNMIPFYSSGSNKFMSLEEANREEVFFSVSSVKWLMRQIGLSRMVDEEDGYEPTWDNEGVYLLSSELEQLSDEHRKAIFNNRHASNLRFLDKKHIAIDWVKSSESSPALSLELSSNNIFLIEMGNDNQVGIRIHKTNDNVTGSCLLNSKNPLVKWLLLLNEDRKKENNELLNRQYKTLFRLIESPLKYSGHEVEKLNMYLCKLKDIPGIDKDMLPPTTKLEVNMFTFAGLSSDGVNFKIDGHFFEV